MASLLYTLHHVLREIARSLASEPVLGALVISLIGNAIPLISVPYFIAILIYSSRASGLHERLAIAVAASAGATAGKLVTYSMGRGASLALSERSRRNADAFVRLARRAAPLFVFLVAALPFPDDILFIPLGVARYPLVPFVISLFLGKLVHHMFVVALGYAASFLFESLTRLPPMEFAASLALVAAATILLSLAIIRIDWEGVLAAYESGGLRSALREALSTIRRRARR
ncbi:MAG: VTT domain-containing protein [Desulfurococcaceae archaeon]